MTSFGVTEKGGGNEKWGGGVVGSKSLFYFFRRKNFKEINWKKRGKYWKEIVGKEEIYEHWRERLIGNEEK